MTKRERKNKASAQLQELRLENAFLRSRIQSVGIKENADPILESGNYFSYLWKLIKAHSAYKLFEKYNGYFSRFRLISRVFKISAYIFIALQTSAILFFAVALLAVIIPPIIIGFSALFIISAIKFPKDAKFLEKKLSGKKVILLFPPRHCNFSADSFLSKNASELADRGYAVIAVSPFVLSSLTLSGSKKLYANLHAHTKGIFTIRRQYFFFINKRILKNHQKRVIYIY
jgi:hypothetical protein